MQPVVNTKFKSFIQKNQFIIPSYDLYGGLSGFQDYGINGQIVKNFLMKEWRQTFLSKDIQEIETPTIMPYNLLYASGHVERFIDYVVYDMDNNCHRADHLIKDWFKNKNLEMDFNVYNLSRIELENVIKKYEIIKGEVKVIPKNLMYQVDEDKFLRPELAQGIFVNFNSYDLNKKELPFGIAQVGKSYRNEISPKSFTRMREFNQAEIEYFVNPNNKIMSDYDIIKNKVVPILNYNSQMNNQKETYSKLEIVPSKIIASFMAKIYDFAIKIGLAPEKIRFRQHCPEEMAHYAIECWDLEAFVNGDWLECIGIADRGDYDLKSHSKKGKSLKSIINNVPIIKCKKTINIKETMLKISNSHTGLKKYQIQQYLKNLKGSEIKKIENEKQNLILNDITIDFNDLYIETKNVMSESQKIFSHVIEPSFGIDRILYAIYEHNLYERLEDNNRIVFNLPNCLLIYHIAILSLQNKDERFNILLRNISELLSKKNYNIYTDSSSVSIGKKYCRIDQLGIKYTITIDPESVESSSVTIREKNSMNQIRIKIDDLLAYFENNFI